VESGFRPTIVALVPPAGGGADLLVVYLRTTDRHLMWTAHSGSAWSGPAEVYDSAGNVAFSNDPASLAPLAGGGAVVAFKGTDGNAYFSTWAGTSWLAPARIVPGGGAIASPPALAAGVCGASATAVLAGTGGGASVTALEGSTWTAPQTIAGVAGATYAGVATTP
jgi:hypothetical protein